MLERQWLFLMAWNLRRLERRCVTRAREYQEKIVRMEADAEKAERNALAFRRDAFAVEMELLNYKNGAM